MNRLASCLIVLAACGGSDDATDAAPPADAAPTADGAPRPDAGARVDAGPEPLSLGEFLVIEAMDRTFDEPPIGRYGRIQGIVRNGEAPVWQHEVANDGTCRLLTFTPAFCDPPCSSDICVGPNLCAPYPTNVSVGQVTIAGLNGGALTLQESPYGYYLTGPRPADLFADDAIVRLSATDLEIETRAVAPLDADLPDLQITIRDGEDYLLTWTPGDDPEARVRLTLNADNASHGLPYDGILECEAWDDAGAIRIPGAMISGFPETENWAACVGSDCPRSWMRRYRRAYALVPGGGIALEVGSEIDFGVVHRR